jgi:raffinose/stachyose/melibiose transport system permease protein
MSPENHVEPKGRGGQGPSVAFGLPAGAFFVAFALVPMAVVVLLSFMHWSGIAAPTWAGLANWRDLARDTVTHKAIWLTVKVMVLSWLVQTPLSILLGVYLARQSRYRSVLGVLFMLPLLLSSTAIALIWKAVLDPNFGGVVNVFSKLGLQELAQGLLSSQTLTLYTVVAVIAWQFIPLHSLLYRAAVRQIPAQLYEAARIDGATTRQQFIYLTLPQLRNTIVASSTLILVGSLTYFDVVYVLTGGGPANATRLLPLDMYLNGFQKYNLGYASVVAVILAAAGIALALGLSRFSGFGRMESDAEGA